MILAADIGTSSLKAGLLTDDGKLTTRVRIPYAHSPGLLNKEFDAMQWADAFLKALKLLPSEQIDAVSISGNGPTLIPCDAKGKPLTPAIMWLHNEANPDNQPSYYLPKAVWLKQNFPKELKKARWLFSPAEWLQYMLSGIPTMTTPHQDFIPWLWDSGQIAAKGLNESLFPDFVTMGDPIGRIERNASAWTGLPEGAVVAATGSDFMATLLGSNITEPGMICDRAGTSEGINICSKAPAADSRLRNLPHLVEGLWNVAAILDSTGAVFEWYRRLTGQQSRSYEETLSEVEKIPPGKLSPLFFPAHDGTDQWSFGGGSFYRLEHGYGPPEMGRAVMEAIGYGVKSAIEILESSGFRVQEMRVTGGQARGAVWNQMKANITGIRLIIPEIEDAELAGCAACALKASGKASTLYEGARRYYSIKKVINPEPEAVKIYKDAYWHYNNIEKQLFS